MTNSADDVIRRLALAPHPEGGCFRETYRHVPAAHGRGLITVIYYLLRAGEVSAWHRIDAVEVWHHYDGAPLRLTVAEDGKAPYAAILGRDLSAGHAGHAVVSPHAWQTAESMGDWTLVGCTVAPAFEFDGFEMAPAGWSPPGTQ